MCWDGYGWWVMGWQVPMGMETQTGPEKGNYIVLPVPHCLYEAKRTNIIILAILCAPTTFTVPATLPATIPSTTDCCHGHSCCDRCQLLLSLRSVLLWWWLWMVWSWQIVGVLVVGVRSWPGWLLSHCQCLGPAVWLLGVIFIAVIVVAQIQVSIVVIVVVWLEGQWIWILECKVWGEGSC